MSQKLNQSNVFRGISSTQKMGYTTEPSGIAMQSGQSVGYRMSLRDAIRKLDELAIHADNHLGNLAALNGEAHQINALLSPSPRPVMAELAELSKAPPPPACMLDELHRAIHDLITRITKANDITSSIRSVMYDTKSVIEGDAQT